MSSSEEDEIIDSMIEEFVEVRDHVRRIITGDVVSSSRNTSRRYIQRNREEAHQRLMNDYFAENALFQVYYFRRRFRMHKPLFLRIVEKVSEVSEFIRQAPDAKGTLGFSSIQKCTAVLRMLAYGTPPDALDEVRMRVVYNATLHTELRQHLTDHIWTLNNLDLNLPPEDELQGQFSDEDPLI